MYKYLSCTNILTFPPEQIRLNSAKFLLTSTASVDYDTKRYIIFSSGSNKNTPVRKVIQHISWCSVFLVWGWPLFYHSSDWSRGRGVSSTRLYTGDYWRITGRTGSLGINYCNPIQGETLQRHFIQYLRVTLTFNCVWYRCFKFSGWIF